MATESIIKNIYIKVVDELKRVPKLPVFFLLVFLIFGIFGGWINTYLLHQDPMKTSFAEALTPPFFVEGGSMKHILGTDQLGRDILSRIITGASISLQVGIAVVFVAGLIGSLVAMLAGYSGGKMDNILMRLVDIVMSMPFLILAVSMAAILGASKFNLIIIISCVAWAWYARVLRADVLRIKQGDFIKLAVVAGCSRARILIRHVFPNILNSLVVLATLNLGSVIIAEASLSFLGLGVPPPDPAWGSMVSEGRSYIGLAWWLTFFPGLAILFVVLSFNLLGDWLRVRLDPKFRQI